MQSVYLSGNKIDYGKILSIFVMFSLFCCLVFISGNQNGSAFVLVTLLLPHLFNFLIISDIIWIDSYPISPYFLFFRQVPKQRWVPKALFWNNSKSKIILKDWNLLDVHAQAYLYFKAFNFIVCVTYSNRMESMEYIFPFYIYLFFYPFACIFTFFFHLGIQTLVSSQSARGHNKSDEDHYWIMFMICEIHVWKF